LTTNLILSPYPRLEALIRVTCVMHEELESLYYMKS
jgi:hypothetical protein